MKHTPVPQQLVTCTVEGGKGRNVLRRATVRLPNTATFGELLACAREKRHGDLELEGPVYGRDGELGITLRDGWVRNSCKVDGTMHIGLGVVVSFPRGSQRPLSLTMGPGATIGDVKQVSLPCLALNAPKHFQYHRRYERCSCRQGVLMLQP